MSAATATPGRTPNMTPGHKRNRSAPTFKGILLTRGHKRTTSEDPKSPSRPRKENSNSCNPFAATSMPALPPDHPHTGQNVLSERQHTNTQSPPKKTSLGRPGLRKRTKSVASLRELIGSKDGKESDTKNTTSSGLSSSKDDKKRGMKGGKTKSSANLAAVFGKARVSKFEEELPQQPKDKENTTPPSSSAYTPNTPIWAQFASQPLLEHTSTTKIPLKDGHSVQDEIALYTPTPQDYSPSKQRNFFDMGQPTLSRTERPKSDGLTMSKSALNFMDTLSRKKSGQSGKNKTSTGNKQDMRRRRSSGSESKTGSPKPSSSSSKGTISGAKDGSRVMATVTMFDRKARQAEVEASSDPKQIDAAFEAVLDARNIPENMREKMRSLKTSVKADFIKSHKAEIEASSSKNVSPESTGARSKPSTPTEEEMNADDKRELESYVQAESQKAKTSVKRNRPRTRTFTFSKGTSSPSKRAKSDNSNDAKSSNIPKSPSSTSLGKSTNSSVFGKTPKPTVPEEFVSYLRMVQRPEKVEVGKLHKLRLLLRNETVSWVDGFIRLGGMAEIVDLLHRIMQVEWREEHEDTLLHEALLCLKGLCTTSLALQTLSKIADTLFPALLAMLFDPEHKGPSEFTTRSIIMNLLFTHLSAATKDIDALPARAQQILSYLRDPAPESDKEPLPWIKDMHQPRPYTIWNREIVNVTKEVFWIFLHHLNVVALPSQPAPAHLTVTTQVDTNDSPKPTSVPGAPKQPPPETLTAQEYFTRFYTQPRPPQPAAPYVGGVEWDATHYLSSHLDLFNGLLASLPTTRERNALRADLRASGFEKIMGGSLRTCKEKFYAHVHDGLRTWVAAAVADGWAVGDVRMGPKVEAVSPKKSPTKKVEKAPRLDVKLSGEERG